MTVQNDQLLTEGATSRPAWAALVDWEPSTRSVEEAVTLPPACYTDPSFFEMERQNVFLREWLCLGRESQVPGPGDYFTITVAGEPLVVVRDRAGTINVLSSVCRHRGMIVTAQHDCPAEEWRCAPAEQAGSGARFFRCPYHFWTYDLEGRLVAAPEMAKTVAFEREEIALPKLAVEVWEGFVFANFDTEASPLGPRLAGVSEMVANWRLSEMVGLEPHKLEALPWNWKIMQENSIEAYHVDRLHSPLHDAVPSSGFFPTPLQEGTGAMVTRVRARHPDFALNPTNKALFPPIATLSEDERSLSMFALVPPTLLFGLNTDSAFYRIVIPRSADSIDIIFGYLVPEEHKGLPAFEELLELASSTHLRFNRQDFMVNHGVQVGLGSAFATRGRYSWQEEPLAYFNQWLIGCYERSL